MGRNDCVFYEALLCVVRAPTVRGGGPYRTCYNTLLCVVGTSPVYDGSAHTVSSQARLPVLQPQTRRAPTYTDSLTTPSTTTSPRPLTISPQPRLPRSLSLQRTATSTHARPAPSCTGPETATSTCTGATSALALRAWCVVSARPTRPSVRRVSAFRHVIAIVRAGSPRDPRPRSFLRTESRTFAAA